MKKFTVYAIHINDFGEKYFKKFLIDAKNANMAEELVKEFTSDLGLNFQYFIAHEGGIV
jgi:D-tyrosyl-tRNA(Tyr) deacylase